MSERDVDFHYLQKFMESVDDRIPFNDGPVLNMAVGASTALKEASRIQLQLVS